MHRTLFFLLTFVFSLTAAAQFGGGSKSSTSKVLASVSEIAPGDQFQVALHLKHPEHWHSYFSNPGSIGIAPSIKWELPEGFTASETRFPIPHTFQGQGATIYGYEGEVTFLYDLVAPASLVPGSDLQLKGKAEWQLCDNTGCIFEDTSFTIALKSAGTSVPANAGLFTKANAKLPKSSDGWDIKVVEEIGTFTLTAIAPDDVAVKGPVQFFSSDRQVDSQDEGDFEIEGQTIMVYGGRNTGDEELFIEAGPILETFSGVLKYETPDGPAAVTVSVPYKPQATEPEVVIPKAAHLGTIKATPEARAAGAAIYDAESRPDYVLLGGKKEKKVTFLSSLGLVFIGGLLLNLMPCVFPVLGLKVMSFVSQAGEDEKKIKIHGLVFGLGLLVTMWILSAIIISLELNWGEQLTNPVFLGAIIIILFVMGLNLYGLFEFGTSMTSVGGELQAKKGYSGSFFSGVLTTLIATPCSGPFLGAVMGFALSQEKPVAFAIFTVFALGIASPYILLSFFPALIKKLPRPGAWMESFKQIMAFLVFATVVFFLKSYLKLVGDDHFSYFLFALTIIGLGVFIYGRWGTPMVAKTKRYITGYGLAGLMTFGGLSWAYSTAKPPEPGLAWNEWYPGILEVSRPKKRIVWVDYTADW